MNFSNCQYLSVLHFKSKLTFDSFIGQLLFFTYVSIVGEVGLLEMNDDHLGLIDSFYQCVFEFQQKHHLLQTQPENYLYFSYD